ncbi:hypothetical protein [Streptomyces eurythermus]
MKGLTQAAQVWIDDPSQNLDAHLVRAFDDLRALSATVPPVQEPTPSR